MLPKIIFISFFCLHQNKQVFHCAQKVNEMSTEISLHIQHYKIPCLGESVKWCYVIKTDTGDFEFFFDEIRDFSFTWGYNYTIIVERRNSEELMQDGSAFTYILKKVLKKEKVEPNYTFEIKLQIAHQKLIENKNGICFVLGDMEIQSGEYSCEDIMKAGAGVFKHSDELNKIVLLNLK